MTLKKSTLMAYRGPLGAAAVAATLLIPYLTMGCLVFYCLNAGGNFSLDASVAITEMQRWALIAHGLYFVILPISFELLVDKLPLPGVPTKFRFGNLPERPDNLFWMMTCLSGELFFVSAVAMLLMASQADVQRWVLLIPIAQCIYNMKNDLIWVGLGKAFSPVGSPVSIMILDWLCVGAFFAIYLHHFFTA